MADFIKVIITFLTNPFVILFIIIDILLVIYSKKIIGWFGELWTKQALKKLPKDKYIVINDVFIKTNGNTHQIDHVIVSPYGIFSVETKQYNGFITGNKYDKYWIRHVGKNKYYYSNPIRQNYGHVKALSELLNVDESKIYNIVCIPSKATLKIQHDGELVRYDTIVDKILSYKDVIIDDVSLIVNIINRNNIIDKKIKKEHIRNIRKNVIDKDPNKCPKCGGQLVERKSKYGKFIGCSNYPKCKYTKK
ncbi:MAG: NERD domain-containing protein [Bacilli bacterium]|nr:NERD domain-containing protein [Bacilli bacterium]